MSDTDLLSEALFASPDDFTLAAALVEHLECDRDMWRSEAEKRVDEIITLGRYARDLVTAADMVKPGAELREYLLGVICRAAQVPEGWPVTVFLVAGEQRATLRTSESIVRGRPRYMFNVTIGATRVIRIARAGDIRKERRRHGGEFLIP